MQVSGFDWDSGNRSKLVSHGVTVSEIEAVFHNRPFIEPDLVHSDAEDRFKAVGKTHDGRYVFIVFTFRGTSSHRLIRPISARFMHAKEIAIYEKAISKIQD
jgi:hypothetical protein